MVFLQKFSKLENFDKNWPLQSLLYIGVYIIQNSIIIIYVSWYMLFSHGKFVISKWR